MRILFIAAVLLGATPALAQAPVSTTTLADGAKAPAGRVIIDGAVWRCEGARCVAKGGADQPATRACRRVVARFGQVSTFTYRGGALTPEQGATCNG